MKCNICGIEIEDMGNNPWPICLEDDHSSRCCNDCNEQFVIPARIIQMRGVKRTIKKNDLVVVFYSKNSETPINTMLETGKMLAGEVTDNEELYEGCWKGTWGNFLLDENVDSFVILEK